MRYGPQHEPIPETEAECQLTTAELRMAKAKHERGQELEFATDDLLVGPQGEKIYPTAESEICPVCGQEMPETCSQPNDEDETDEDAPVVDDITELSA